MILRRFMKHVSDQNWFAVGLDVLVVVFGVYLGIFIGDEVSRNAEKADIAQSLTSMQNELSVDLKAVEEIIQAQSVVRDSFSQVVLLLLAEEQDEEALQSAMQDVTSVTTPTFYPNQSSYRAIVSASQLTKIQPNELKHAVTQLFEHTYVRHAEYTKLYDAYLDATFKDLISRYWDRNKQRLMTTTPLEVDIFRSSLQGQISYTDDYISFLKDNVQPPMQGLHLQLTERSK